MAALEQAKQVSADSPTTSLEHLTRAARIFGHIGHVAGRGEALWEAAGIEAEAAGQGAVAPPIATFYTDMPRVLGPVAAPATSHPHDVASLVLRATAAMGDLMSRPVLAGYELLSLVTAANVHDGAWLVVRGQGAASCLAWAAGPAVSPPETVDDLVDIALGPDTEGDVSVLVRPRGYGSPRTTLLALQRLALSARERYETEKAESEKSSLWPEPLPEQQLGFVCASEIMLDLLRTTRRIAASNITVLVTGETGTGKELLARALHQCSPRHAATFVPYNCTAVAKDMLDSQLFGYRKGAFTGAQEAFPGVIRGASGGTLFLDEIGEIGLDLQPKLLRFLESSEVHALGDSVPTKVDVRVVAATNADLDGLVARGHFRSDLFYRLNVVRLHIPPLRERREEIPLLINHFLDKSMREAGKHGLRLSDTIVEYLLLYKWPGNVRELANEMRRLATLAESGAVLMPEHLSAKIAASRRTIPSDERPIDPTELIVARQQPLSAAIEHVERAFILDAMRKHPNVEDAARALGLSRKGLYLKRQRLHIDDD